ncbi:MAG: TetR/AcrR family transcriptional regulator [Candidatus Cloacimonas sp.]|nr:TetR/AcrR family transcriptional regulator [Candidatus Cloacimonas sp.]
MARISEAEKIQRRLTILDAAISLFSQRGFHGVNTAELASSAGIAEGTIFRYFKSKEELLISALIHVMAKLLEELKSNDLPNEHVSKRLSRFIDNHLKLIKENPELTRFITIELRQTPEFMRRYPNYNPLAGYLDFLREILFKGMERGEIRAINLESLVSIIFGTIDYVMATWHISDAHIELEKTILDLREIIYNGVKPEGK